METAYWGEYEALMASLRMGEVLSFERWGKGGRPHDRAEMTAMQQLRMGLAALWVGFNE